MTKKAVKNKKGKGKLTRAAPSRYAGVRAVAGTAVFRDGQLFASAPSAEVRKYTDGSFEWGVACGGARQLSLALLLDYTQDEERSLALCDDFMHEVVLRLNHDYWCIEGWQLKHWLETRPKKA